jgi:hypothetical protein
MQLELNGRIISNQPDKITIEQTILNMAEDGSILTLSDGRRAFIQAAGNRSSGFIMTGQDGSGQRQYDQLNAVGTAEVILAFSAFFSGSESWKQTVPPNKPVPKNKPGQMSGKSILAILIVIFVVVIGMVGFGMFMSARSGGAVNSAELTQFIPIAAAIAFYFGWLIFLFSWFRPRLAGWLAQMLNTQVNENIISGSWQTGGALWKRIFVVIVEIVVFIPGAFLPLLAIGYILLQ